MSEESIHDERWQPLVDRVTEGVEAPSEALSVETVAANLQVGLLKEQGLDPLPASLRAKLMGTIPTPSEKLPPVIRPDFRRSATLWGSWMTAAACLVLAVMIYRSQQSGTFSELTSVRRPPIEELEKVSDLIRVMLPAKGVASGAPTGEILWSNARQEGVLKLRGLRPNDPASEQFQLWIVDPQRDPSFPVDGGVFDISSSGEVVVPIQAKLRILQPKAFVITREHPGGVVKSTSKTPVLMASVP